MSRYKNLIHELEQENVADRRTAAEHRVEAGRSLYEAGHAVVINDANKETRDELEGVAERLEATERKITRIEEIITRTSEIKDEISQARREISRLENEVVPVFEQIGERAFELYRNNDYLENEYTEEFRDLVQRSNEISEIDHEIEELENSGEDASMLKRWVSGGRMALLRSRRNSKLEALPKLYRKAGAALCETDFLATMNDTQLNQIAEPFLAARRRIQQLEDSIGELDHERERLRAELHEMDAEKRPSRAVAALQERVEELKARRNECYGRLTDQVIESNADLTDLPEAARTAIEEIGRLEAEQEKRQERISRLEAAIEAEQVASEIERLEQRTGTLRERLAEIQNEIEKTDGRIAETKQRHQQLMALRGSEDDL